MGLPAAELPIAADTPRLCREQLRAAVFHLVSALQADDGDADTWCGLGTTLAQLGDRAGALMALRNSLRHDADHIPAHLALGRLLFDSGQLEPALTCFERVRNACGYR